MSFLLDTDTCSAHLKRPAGLTSRFVQHAGRLHVSVLTVGELRAWVDRSGASPQRRVGLDEMLREMNVLPVDDGVAATFGALRAGQIDAGTLTPTTDLWIASTAIAHGLSLVTHNTSDFEHVPGLTLFDWLEP